jgi:drug/metabolite transporter (DMT)-like permease
MQEQQSVTQQPQGPTVKPERTPKKMLPEFIFGIAIMLLGGYQIDNNLIMGGVLVISGTILVAAYLISNRKKVIKNVPDKQ